jgi:hypothetical protein
VLPCCPDTLKPVPCHQACSLLVALTATLCYALSRSLLTGLPQQSLVRASGRTLGARRHLCRQQRASTYVLRMLHWRIAGLCYECCTGALQPALRARVASPGSVRRTVASTAAASCMICCTCARSCPTTRSTAGSSAPSAHTAAAQGSARSSARSVRAAAGLQVCGTKPAPEGAHALARCHSVSRACVLAMRSPSGGGSHGSLMCCVPRLPGWACPWKPTAVASARW